MPSHWSRANPVDMLGNASVKEYCQVVDICVNAPEINSLLILLTPQAMIDPTAVANALLDKIKAIPFPVLTSWVGGPSVEGGREGFNHDGIPTLDTPERAIRAFANLWHYSRNLELLQQIPSRLPRGSTLTAREHVRSFRTGWNAKKKSSLRLSQKRF